MAERIAQKMAEDTGLTCVNFTSAAVLRDEAGNPMDPRAVRVLQRGGYRAAGHRAHQITAGEIRDADLVVGMEPRHIERMQRLVPSATNLRLITDFDPDAAPGSGIEDPWYGPESGFEVTRAALERAVPGVLDWVRSRQNADKDSGN